MKGARKIIKGAEKNDEGFVQRIMTKGEENSEEIMVVEKIVQGV